MNGIQLLLLLLISTLQTTTIDCVTRFQMKSCVTTRNVTMVLPYARPVDDNRIEFYHYRRVKR